MQIKIIHNYLDTYVDSTKNVDLYSNYIKELLDNKKGNIDTISFDKEKSQLTITCITSSCSQKMQFQVDYSIKKGISYTCPFCNVRLFKSSIFMYPINSIILPKIEIMIGGVIIQILSSWLKDIGDNDDTCEVVRESDKIAFRAYDKTRTNYLVLELYFSHQSQIIYVPTILVNGKLFHTGTGMKMLRTVFDICESFKYELYIVNMVPSFFKRMIDRGAIQSDLDAVRISKDTDLTYHYPSVSTTETNN